MAHHAPSPSFVQASSLAIAAGAAGQADEKRASGRIRRHCSQHPIIGPGCGRYLAAKDGRPDGPPYWWDTVTRTRLDLPPWKLKSDGSG